MQALEGNDQHQHTLHYQPAEGVFEKQTLHAAVANRADFGVVGRIQVQQREGLRLGNGVEGIALDSRDAPCTCSQCSLGIEFYTVTPYIGALGNQVESHALTHAWIDHRCRSSEAEKLTKITAFARWEWVKPHLQTRNITRHGSSFGDELWVVSQVVYSSGGGALRTMMKKVPSEIDTEIARLKQAGALLKASGVVVAKCKPGRPAKAASFAAPQVQKARKRGKLSAEARERIRQAQIKRGAAVKGASKTNMNAPVASLPKAKKKAAKAA